MPLFLKKNWRHVFFVLVLVFYVFAAPGIYDRLFIKHGWPAGHGGKWSQRLIDGYSSIDRLVPAAGEKGLYRLNGWAFTPSLADHVLQDDDREVVLFSSSRVYLFPAEARKRPELQARFEEQNLGVDVTWAGFSALINPGAIEPGCYRIGLLLRDAEDGITYTVRTGRMLRRTPNMLLLEEVDMPDCSPGNG